MTAALEMIKQTFDKKYAAWNLILPAESLGEQGRGSIIKMGYCQEFYLAGSEQAEQGYYEHNRKFYGGLEQS